MSSFSTRLVITLTGLLFIQLHSKVLLIAESLNGYGSKVACSCHFLQNRTLQHIAERELSWPPIAMFVQLQADSNARCVTSRFKWAPSLGVRRACLKQNVRLGCAVVERSRWNETQPFKPTKVSKTFVDDDMDVFVKASKPFEHPLLDEHFEDEWLNARSMLILNASTFPAEILYERYGDGFTPSTPQAGWSMTKSLLSMLIGALLKTKPDAFPEGVDTMVPDLGMTVEHLLRMVDGLDWDEVYAPFMDPVNMLFVHEDVGETPKSQRVNQGECFRYSSKSSNLLSKWIRSLFPSKLEYDEFPFRYLLDKINARSAVLETDPQGTFVASSFSFMTARDWARLGVLLAREGSWPVLQNDGRTRRNQEVLPNDYVRRIRSVTRTSRGSYGMHFWLGGNIESKDDHVRNPPCDRAFTARVNPSREWCRGLPQDTFFMSGFEGQYVLVVPESKIVLVRLGASREQMPGWKVFQPGELFIPVLDQLLKRSPQ